MKYSEGKGQDLYKHAKTIIAGGTQLLSKRPEMFLPEGWPAYYSKAKGCEVWDLDGRHYYDMSLMGVGACAQGYANDEIDEAAIEAIQSGCMCTLNAPEECDVADKMLELHPWADEVRYAKAGGEIVNMAVRIARAHTRKDIVLFCGYHGWFDWYLAANLRNENALDDLHLPGLEPLGVPSGLAGTNLPFHYNKIEEFYALIEKNRGNIAAVVMEPLRNDLPVDGFLKKIRDTTKEEGIVLVFDEISSGFRLCAGGAHKTLGVEPDMATFAKAMTNGYPLTAVIGRKEVMEAAQGTFISSTFYTERVGLAATLKSIETYERDHVWKRQIEVGKKVKQGWQNLASKFDLPLTVSGIDPLAHFGFDVNEPLVYKTYITQEMLKRGYLASNGLYACTAHTDEIVDGYLEQLGEVFSQIADIKSTNSSLAEHLEGPVCHSGFGRLL